MSRSDWPKDPFVKGPPMKEDHSVIKYLDWQIACHSQMLEIASNSYFDDAVQKFKRDVDDFDIKDYGIPNRTFESMEYTLNELKRISNQLQLLKKERLRLLRDVDFHGFNYML